MICFSAIVPHSPKIIPTINQEDLDKANKTINAYKILSKQLAKVKPESLVIISSHAPILDGAFSINLAQEYEGNFKSFGDLITKIQFKGDLELNYKIREKFEMDFSASSADKPDVPLTMMTEPHLDYGTFIPLYYFFQEYKDFSIIPVSHCSLDYQQHLDFGQKLREELTLTNKRVAIVASAGLSGCSEKEKPKDTSIGQQFDQKMIKLIKNKKTDQILKLNQKLIEKSGQCGLRPILILLGILKELNYQPEILSYEAPFGTGYLVANLKFS
ncbi:AmmeMemoRadiSam system protein B [Patescibacteria group bacterium]|nr:AmmeMemoRadiSam system protein B [Patescibacteria group bacterium]